MIMSSTQRGPVELFETLLAAIGAARDFEPTRGERTQQAHSVIVKIAEDYSLSHAGDHIM